ncbi:hypothetical protein BOX15_Mlig030346g1, partial [Macrostomum lignano]
PAVATTRVRLMSDWHRRGGGQSPTGCACILSIGGVGCALLLGSAHPLVSLAICLAAPASFYIAIRRLRASRTRCPALFAITCATVLLAYICVAVVTAILRVVLLWEHMSLNLLWILTCLSIRRTRTASLPGSIDDSVESGHGDTGGGSEGGGADVCSICERSIQHLDHHCWWLDCCIGRPNRRSYLITLILCIATGCYGILLTTTSICTPAIYMDWFLLPADCRFLYYDGLHSFAVSGCALVLTCAILLLCELIVQLTLITAGATWHELSRSSSSTFDMLLTLMSRLTRRHVGVCATAWLDLCLHWR